MLFFPLTKSVSSTNEHKPLQKYDLVELGKYITLAEIDKNAGSN